MELPIEIWMRIAMFLSPQSLARLAQTNRLLRTVCSDESVWKLLGDKDVYAKAFVHFWRLRARTLRSAKLLDEAVSTTWWISSGSKAMRDLLFPYCIKVSSLACSSGFVIMSKHTIWYITAEKEEDVWKCNKYTAKEEFFAHETFDENVVRRSTNTRQLGWVNDGVKRLCVLMVRILHERMTSLQVWQMNPFLICFISLIDNKANAQDTSK